MVASTLSFSAPAAGACPDATQPADGTVSTAAPTARQWTECTGFTAGQKYSGTVDVTYQLQGSTISHTSTVSFQGTVE